MPDRTAGLLFRFLHQNVGVLSKRAREEEFASLTEAEAAQAEEAYKSIPASINTESDASR